MPDRPVDAVAARCRANLAGGELVAWGSVAAEAIEAIVGMQAEMERAVQSASCLFENSGVWGCEVCHPKCAAAAFAEWLRS